MPRIRPHIPARAGCSATSKSTSEIVHFAILCQNYGRGHRAYALAWAVHSGGARTEPAHAPSRPATFEAQRLYLPSLFPGSGSIRSRESAYLISKLFVGCALAAQARKEGALRTFRRQNGLLGCRLRRGLRGLLWKSEPSWLPPTCLKSASGQSWPWSI